MRRKDDTLRDTLLEYARELADSEGLEAVNIRSIAGKAGVAAGTVYIIILQARMKSCWRLRKNTGKKRCRK